jgi:hypothetical protein
MVDFNDAKNLKKQADDKGWTDQAKEEYEERMKKDDQGQQDSNQAPIQQ